MADRSEDVVGTVARGIYYAFAQPLQGKQPWFDQLDPEAKSFLRAQARKGLEDIRDPTDGMIAAASAVCDLEAAEIEAVWVSIMDYILRQAV